MPNCLIVDDVTVTRFAAQSFLEELGVDSTEAEDGDAALAALEAGGVDVVLLDWHLKKKSGLELLGAIREKYGKSLKVIVFSGVEGGDKANEAKAAGADGFISKPTTKEKLEAEFKNVGVL